jgi:hypothetical protein
MGTPLDEHKLSHFSDPKPPSEEPSLIPEAGLMGASLAAGEERLTSSLTIYTCLVTRLIFLQCETTTRSHDRARICFEES